MATGSEPHDEQAPSAPRQAVRTDRQGNIRRNIKQNIRAIGRRADATGKVE